MTEHRNIPMKANAGHYKGQLACLVMPDGKTLTREQEQSALKSGFAEAEGDQHYKALPPEMKQKVAKVEQRALSESCEEMQTGINEANAKQHKSTDAKGPGKSAKATVGFHP
jgi:hypothetical protein